MKKILAILLLVFSILLQAQDQSKYGAFLDDAHKYANENDAEKFEYCLNGFFIAINTDEITPQSLTSDNQS